MPVAEIQVADFYVDLNLELGRGGFGTVYQASDHNGRYIAAIKVPVAGQRQAAAREAVNFYNIKHNHPNIIKIFDVKYDKDMWIFMEICDGDLRQYCHTNARELQSMNHRLNIMLQMAQGVAYLHDNNIVHRDIKPENILICHDDSHLVVKLTDFGLAKILDPEDVTSGMSTDVGTFNFKAPEFWKRTHSGHLKYHRDVDIFSVGLTFLCMLQISDGRELYPEIENTVDTQTEKGNPIGMVMYYREIRNQPDVNVIADKAEDDGPVKSMKAIIRKMTCVRPKDRIPIHEVLTNLRKVLHFVYLFTIHI